MDAAVKGRLRFLLLVVGHGGGRWGLAAGAMATTTVTLRYAGRDRRTVSGRELPRTRNACWLTHRPIEDPPAQSHRPPHPSWMLSGKSRRRGVRRWRPPGFAVRDERVARSVQPRGTRPARERPRRSPPWSVSRPG